MVDNSPSVPADTMMNTEERKRIIQDQDGCYSDFRVKRLCGDAKDNTVCPADTTIRLKIAADSNCSPRHFNPETLYKDDGMCTATAVDNKVFPQTADSYSRPYHLENHIRQDLHSTQDAFASRSHRQYIITAISPDDLRTTINKQETINNASDVCVAQPRSFIASESLRESPPSDGRNGKVYLPSYPIHRDQHNMLEDEVTFHSYNHLSSTHLSGQQVSTTDWWDFYMAKNRNNDDSNITRTPNISSAHPRPTIPAAPEAYANRIVLTSDCDSSFWQESGHHISHQSDLNDNSAACRVSSDGNDIMTSASYNEFPGLNDQQRYDSYTCGTNILPPSICHEQGPRCDVEHTSHSSTLRSPPWRNSHVFVHGKNFPSSSGILQPYYNRQIQTLSMEDDDRHLSVFLCFVRSQCVEVFSASHDDFLSRINSKTITMDQAGIRCRFCAHFPSRERTGRSSSFPSSTSRIYQSLTMMLRDHFSECPAMPLQVLETYHRLKANDSKGRTDSKKYWIESARVLGLFDTGKNGMRLRPQHNDQLLRRLWEVR